MSESQPLPTRVPQTIEQAISPNPIAINNLALGKGFAAQRLLPEGLSIIIHPQESGEVLVRLTGSESWKNKLVAIGWVQVQGVDNPPEIFLVPLGQTQQGSPSYGEIRLPNPGNLAAIYLPKGPYPTSLLNGRLTHDVLPQSIIHSSDSAVTIGAWRNLWQTSQRDLSPQVSKTLSSVLEKVGKERAHFQNLGNHHNPTAWFQPSLFHNLTDLSFSAILKVVLSSTLRFKDVFLYYFLLKWVSRRYVGKQSEVLNDTASEASSPDW